MKRIRPTFTIHNDRGVKHYFMLWGNYYATSPVTALCGKPYSEMNKKGVPIHYCEECSEARMEVIRADMIAQRLLGPEESGAED